MNQFTQDDWIDFEDLKLDPKNPRVPTEIFENDDDSIRFLVDEYDVEELIQSILTSGWIDYEPLIVQEKTNIVFEGNRRLAALRLIHDPKLRSRISYRLPDIPQLEKIPSKIRVKYVSDRADARRFIAFKHINGPFKWDAYAKAKYATDWLDEGADIDVVSRTLGDNHNTVRRLVLGYRVLQQAQKLGFDINDRSKKHFAFSHLYTALMRPSARDYIGVTGDEVTPDPVPSNHYENLSKLMSWLYGQESQGEGTIIASQNPNLNQLVKVLANDRALSILEASRRLDVAYEEVEPPSDRFRESLVLASRQCENALGLSTHYQGDDGDYSLVQQLAQTVRTLRDAMAKVKMGTGDDL